MKKGYYLLPAFFIVMIFVFQFFMLTSNNKTLILAFIKSNQIETIETGSVKNSSIINAVTTSDPVTGEDTTQLDLGFSVYEPLNYLRVEETTNQALCSEIKCMMPDGTIMNPPITDCKLRFDFVNLLSAGVYPVTCYIEDSAGVTKVEESVHIVVQNGSICIENDGTCIFQEENITEDPATDEGSTAELDLGFSVYTALNLLKVEELSGQKLCSEIMCKMPNGEIMSPPITDCKLRFDFVNLLNAGVYPVTCYIKDSAGNIEIKESTNIVVKVDRNICIENGTTCIFEEITTEEPDTTNDDDIINTEPETTSENTEDPTSTNTDPTDEENDDNIEESNENTDTSRLDLDFYIYRTLELLTVKELSGQKACSEIICKMPSGNWTEYISPVETASCTLRFSFGTLLEPGIYNIPCYIKNNTGVKEIEESVNIIVKRDKNFCIENGVTCIFEEEEVIQEPEEPTTDIEPIITPDTIINDSEETSTDIIPDAARLDLSLTSRKMSTNGDKQEICVETNKRSNVNCRIEGSDVDLKLMEISYNHYCAYSNLLEAGPGIYHVVCRATDNITSAEKRIDIEFIKTTQEEDEIIKNIEREAILEAKCNDFGIEDREECQKYLSEIYTNKVLEKITTNEEMATERIQNIVNENIAEIIKLQTRNELINLNSSKILEKNLRVSEIEEEINQNNEAEKISLPIREKEVMITALKAKENIKIEEDKIIQSAPIVIIIDDDGDGIPNDIEIRIGTDPKNADTDGDGYNDGEEIRSSYNPLGEGKKETIISAIEKAIINKKEIEHPRTNGEIKENFIVEKIENNEENGYKLSGTAEANSVITLYIYSDIPVVTTVTTDEYGNWQYEFAESLEDGEHEIYIAINDDTGKIVSKSNPLSFMVKEAKAVSASEITDIKDTLDRNEDSKDMLIYYLIIAGVGIAAGILMFLYILVSKKSKTKIK